MCMETVQAVHCSLSTCCEVFSASQLPTATAAAAFRELTRSAATPAAGRASGGDAAPVS